MYKRLAWLGTRTNYCYDVLYSISNCFRPDRQWRRKRGGAIDMQARAPFVIVTFDFIVVCMLASDQMKGTVAVVDWCVWYNMRRLRPLDASVWRWHTELSKEEEGMNVSWLRVILCWYEECEAYCDYSWGSCIKLVLRFWYRATVTADIEIGYQALLVCQGFN